MHAERKKVSQGRWSDDVSWEFFVTEILPDEGLCTAVCCFAFYHNQLLLVRNRRGWEVPAGHVETGETLEQAIKREVLEETGATLAVVKPFGYKELTARSKILRPNSTEHYPFPTSYAVYYIGLVHAIETSLLAPDALAAELVSIDDASQRLAPSNQYTGLIDHIVKNNLVPR